MRLRLFIGCFILTLTVLTVHAQENIGLQLSNYMPASAVQMNPAFIVDSRTHLDVHLVGVAIFFQNDHSFYAGEGPGFFSILGGTAGDPGENPSIGERSGYLDLSVEGPSFALVMGRSSIGVNTRYRSMVQGEGVPDGLAQFIHNGFRYSALFDTTLFVDDLKLTSLSWAEMSFSYGRMLQVSNEHHLNAGITVKRLFGLQHLAMDMQDASYFVTGTNISIDNFTGGYAIGESGFGAGNGWGLDLGVVYQKTIKGKADYVPFSQKSRCRKSEYRYKAGLSLLDYGGVNFKQTGADVRVENASIFWENYLDTEVGDVAALDQLLIDRVETDQNQTNRTDGASVALPFSVALQFDYNFNKGFYCGAYLQQSLKRAGRYDLKRADVLGFVPRYEKERFEASLPLSFYDYTRLRLGAAVRINFFTLGSDNLSAIIQDDDIYGADFYLGFRIPFYGTSACGSKGGKRALVAPCWGQ